MFHFLTIVSSTDPDECVEEVVGVNSTGICVVSDKVSTMFSWFAVTDELVVVITFSAFDIVMVSVISALFGPVEGSARLVDITRTLLAVSVFELTSL